VVASLVPTLAVGQEHSCTNDAAARSVVVDTTCDFPSIVVEGDTKVLWVGSTPCGTLEEHR
jgi:hypothetical protein